MTNKKGDKMFDRNKTYNELLEDDIKYIREVLQRLKNDITWDEDYYGWLLQEEKPLTEYLFEEENTIINPKELEGEIDNIIENELKIKKY